MASKARIERMAAEIFGNDIVDRAIEAATCKCGGKCACHHPNPAVAAVVKQNGQCKCEAANEQG